MPEDFHSGDGWNAITIPAVAVFGLFAFKGGENPYHKLHPGIQLNKASTMTTQNVLREITSSLKISVRGLVGSPNVSIVSVLMLKGNS